MQEAGNGHGENASTCVPYEGNYNRDSKSASGVVMAKLVFLPYPDTDPEQLAFIRRTRTVCIYTADRRGIYSKNLVRIVASCQATQNRVDDIFCVDAVGSKNGHLIGYASHFKGFAEGAEIDVEIHPATPDDCVKWLEGNEDPERKVLGQILNFALEGAKETRQLAALSEENFRAAKNDRFAAAQDKKKGILYGLAGFIGGIILDVGMLEEKLGLKLPLPLILGLFGLTIAAILAAVLLVRKSQPGQAQRPLED